MRQTRQAWCVSGTQPAGIDFLYDTPHTVCRCMCWCVRLFILFLHILFCCSQVLKNGNTVFCSFESMCYVLSRAFFIFCCDVNASNCTVRCFLCVFACVRACVRLSICFPGVRVRCSLSLTCVALLLVLVFSVGLFLHSLSFFLTFSYAAVTNR